MVLVDTSVWINHLRSADATLVSLLEQGQVLMHPFVLGEIALGSLRQRELILQLLDDLPQAALAMDAEVRALIQRHELFGEGIGYVDAHLLVSAFLSYVKIWTQDKRLHAVAARLGVAATF